MNKIKTQVHVSRISSRADGSIGISMVTPELTTNEKALFFELHNVNCTMALEPLDTPDIPELKIDKDVENKTQSERIRSVLYLLWRQEGEQGDFKTYYYNTTEKWIDKLKERIND